MPALIKPKDALLCKESIVFIDTRAPEAYAEGHIIGSVNMRELFSYVSMSTEKDLSALQGKFAALFGAAGLTGKERAVFYEDAMDNGNGQSSRGYYLLKYLGYPCASVLHGGYQAWVEAGYPTTNQAYFPRPAAFPVCVDHSMMLTKEDILTAIGDDKTVILDVRDADEWYGNYTSPTGADPAMRRGRIPGAVWMEWRKLLDLDKSPAEFKTPAQIEATCREYGITRSTPVYIYCFKGSRASSTYIALREAGFTDVRNYFASWNEWSRDPALPIDQEILRSEDRIEARAA